MHASRETFLNVWLGKTCHDLELRALPSRHVLFTRDLDEIERFAAEHEGGHIFFGCGSREGGGTKSHVRELPLLWADLDFDKYPGGATEARQRLGGFPLTPSIVVSTGGGLHAYWWLKEAVQPTPEVEAILRGISQALGADPAVCDLARVMRLPGSWNWKYESRPQVVIERRSEAEYVLDHFGQFRQIRPEEVPEVAAEKTDLAGRIDEINSRCLFLRHCYEHQAELSEPLWYAMVSNLVRLPDGIHLVHQYSRDYPGYSERETDQKALHALKDTGPHTCEHIRENGFSCPNDCRVKAPIVRVTGNGYLDEEASSPDTGETKETQAEKMVRLASRCTLFHDDMKDAFAEVGGQNLRVRGSEFKRFLAKLLWDEERKAPNTDALNQALNVLEAKALFEGSLRVLHNRVAFHEGALLYDLGDGRAVRVTPGQWEVVTNPPMIFRHYPHQQVQVDPQRGGSLESLFRYVNVLDQDHRILVQVLLVSFFVPHIARPILVSWGDQGSGKTTICVVFKILIDPSKLSVLFAPRDLGETVQALDHHYFLSLDNLSAIPDWLSDVLAQAVTGAGLSKRRLYTDDEDLILQVRRGIAINGINQVLQKPDVMDRSVLVHHDRISPNRRRSERELFDDFEKDRPYILGAVFDALAMAMEIMPRISLPELPRMADFALWGSAIAGALGFGQEAFLSAYGKNMKTQNEEVVAGNSLAQAVLSLMEDMVEWNGTVREAYEALHEIASPKDRDGTFPRAPNKLRRHLERIRPNLREYGVTFAISNYSTRDGVRMAFQKVSEGSPLSSLPHSQAEINGLGGTATVKVQGGVNVSSPVCSREGVCGDDPFGDGEDGDHRKPGRWSDPDFIPEASLPREGDIPDVEGDICRY